MHCVYMARNKINGKIYIGRTKDFNSRRKQHLKCRGNGYFHQAIRKYGFNNFEWEILEGNISEKNIVSVEGRYIEKYKSDNREFGYNSQNVKDGVTTHSEETKIRMSKSHKDKKLSKPHCKKISDSRKGMTFSEEHRKNLSKSIKGKTKGKKKPDRTSEHIKNHIESRKRNQLKKIEERESHYLSLWD